LTASKKRSARKKGSRRPRSSDGAAASMRVCTDCECGLHGGEVRYDPRLWKGCPLGAWKERADHERELLDAAKDALATERKRTTALRRQGYKRSSRED